MSNITMQDDLARQGRRHSSVLWLTLLGMILFVVWAYFAILDEVTVGTGKVTPLSRAQLIESLTVGLSITCMCTKGTSSTRARNWRSWM